MPVYCWKCESCSLKREAINSKPTPPDCQSCGQPMVRDFREEGFVSTFHPTRDLLANRPVKGES